MPNTRRTNFKLNFRATITNDGDKFHAARRRQRTRISAWMPPSLVVPLWLVACLAAWADGSDNKRTTRALV